MSLPKKFKFSELEIVAQLTAMKNYYEGMDEGEDSVKSETDIQDLYSFCLDIDEDMEYLENGEDYLDFEEVFDENEMLEICEVLKHIAVALVGSNINKQSYLDMIDKIEGTELRIQAKHQPYEGD